MFLGFLKFETSSLVLQTAVIRFAVSAFISLIDGLIVFPDD